VKPVVVVLSAPSGGGKTTIARALLAKRSDLGYSVSATTRPPRPGERDGEAYHFLSDAEFARRRRAGEFLEAARYAGHWYGTFKSEVERILASGRHAVLDIDVQGARQVRAAYPPPASLSIFILPPSVAVLLERLGRRRSESPDDLRRRVRGAMAELREAPQYDYVVVNDDLAEAVGAVSAIIDASAAGRAAVPPRPADFERRLDALVRDLAQAAGDGARR
jgi:guanylate kinase